MSTFLSAGQTFGRKNVIDEHGGRSLGEVCMFTDVAVVNGQLVRARGGAKVMARVVEADGVLAAGNAVQWTDNKFGTNVDVVAVDGGRVDGIVDPTLTASLAAGDTFLLIVGGPVDAVASGSIAGQYFVGAGSGKIKTAAVSTAGASGRVLEDVTSSSDGDVVRVHLFPESTC